MKDLVYAVEYEKLNIDQGVSQVKRIQVYLTEGIDIWRML
jgi:hypothetical protein